jgi:hypothetical protein
MRSRPARAPQDELLAQLIVVLSVDHGQPDRSCAARQVDVLDVELVVLIHAGREAAIGVAVGANRRGFVERDRVGLAAFVHRSERSIHVDAGDHDEPQVGRQRSEDCFCVSACQCAAVDRSVGLEAGQLFAVCDQLSPLDVQVRHLGHVVGFEISAVDDQQVMAGGGELLDDRSPNEPGATEDYDSQSIRHLALRCRPDLLRPSPMPPHRQPCACVSTLRQSHP